MVFYRLLWADVLSSIINTHTYTHTYCSGLKYSLGTTVGNFFFYTFLDPKIKTKIKLNRLTFLGIRAVDFFIRDFKIYRLHKNKYVFIVSEQSTCTEFDHNFAWIQFRFIWNLIFYFYFDITKIANTFPEDLLNLILNKNS